LSDTEKELRDMSAETARDFLAKEMKSQGIKTTKIGCLVIQGVGS
jgi:hypothetical protein